MPQDKPPTPSEAASELLRRRVARNDGAEYRHYVSGLKVAPHSRLVWKKLHDVMEGRTKRLMVFMPPGSAKTLDISHHFPAYYLSKYPQYPIIGATHTDKFAEQNGRRVRNIIQSDEHQTLFPGVTVSEESSAAARWELSNGGMYMGFGVGATVVGRRAGGLILDDVVAGIAAADSAVERDFVYSWYGADLSTRLIPNGFIILVMCVAEGERVLTVERGWVPIQDINVGEYVWTYDNGVPKKRAVLKKSCSGEDDILSVVSQSSTLRVNKRHPFLVVAGGGKRKDWSLEWRDAGSLQPGDVVVTQKNITHNDGYRFQNPYTGKIANHDLYWMLGFILGDGWIAKTKTRVQAFCVALSKYPTLNEKITSTIFKVFGKGVYTTKYGYVRVCSAPIAKWLISIGFGGTAHTKRVPSWVYKMRASDQRAFLRGYLDADGYQRQGVKKEQKEHLKQWTASSCNRALLDDFRLLARMCGVKPTKIYENHLLRKAPNSKEAKHHLNFMTRFNFKNGRIEKRARYNGQRELGMNYRFEEIDAVIPGGRSPVYDLTVEGSENFIAEGFVVHNTRYHPDDIAGRLLAGSSAKFGDQWEVLSLPALAKAGDPLGRVEGEALWPEWQSKKELLRIKSQPSMTARLWASLYQQEPVAEGGNIIQRSWFKLWRSKEPPECKYIIQSWDTALSKDNRAAYSSCLTYGVFDEPDTGLPAMILLSRWRAKKEYPELKAMARRLYFNYLDDRTDMPMLHPTKMSPDILLIEDQATGKPLIAEFARAGIIAHAFPAQKYGSKDNRLKMSMDIMEAGRIYVPAIPPNFTQPRKFADEYITSLSAWPASEARDDVDATSQAIIRLKTSGWIYQAEDKPPEPGWREYQSKEAIY